MLNIRFFRFISLMFCLCVIAFLLVACGSEENGIGTKNIFSPFPRDQIMTQQKICSHDSAAWTVIAEASCTEAGQRQLYCNDCETILQTEMISAKGHSYKLTQTVAATEQTTGQSVYTCSDCSHSYTVTLPKLGSYDADSPTMLYLSDDNISIINDNGGVKVDNNTVTLSIAGSYSLSGSLSKGNIIVTVAETEKVELELNGVSISCSTAAPVSVTCADGVEITAKKGTENFLCDKRTADDTIDPSGGALESACDTKLKGKGTLSVSGTYNNGVDSNKDLIIQNLTLKVTAKNHALKGNDSVTVESGTLTVISTGADGIKTSDSDISEKGVQRGTVTISGGMLDIYAACDGIDAAYDVVISEDAHVSVFTDKYSTYSEKVTATAAETLYLRTSSAAYRYAVLFSSTDGISEWKTAIETPSHSGGFERYYTFSLEKPSGYTYLQVYAYTSSQTLCSDTAYAACSSQVSINDSFDLLSLSVRNGSLSCSWGTYTISSPGGFPGGGGGMQDGNSDKGIYSTKGIKAADAVLVSGGAVTVKAYDDALHAGSDTVLESGNYGSGNIILSGGTVTLSSNDDGVHADGELTVSGGVLSVNDSYEALEGMQIVISGGTTSLCSSDDGLNAINTLIIEGGVLYLNANGDGIDSNGTVVMTGGVVVAQGPTNGGNGVIDFDRSFTFKGGVLLAVGCSGMNQKPTAVSGGASDVLSVSTQSTLSSGNYLIASHGSEVICALRITKSNMNYIVFAASGYGTGTYTLSLSSSYSGTAQAGECYMGGTVSGSTVKNFSVSSFPYNS